MSNDSSTGGYLSPASSPAPLEGDALDDFLQALVVGITGLPAPMVRPRWQPTPPTQPKPSVDWCAIGVVRQQADTFAAVLHSPSGDGSDSIQRHEVLDLMASFYGPNAQSYAAILRDGLSVAQNREALTLANMGLVGVGDVIAAPELVNQQWIRRFDLTVTIRRQIIRTYPVLNILSASGTIQTAVITEEFDA